MNPLRSTPFDKNGLRIPLLTTLYFGVLAAIGFLGTDAPNQPLSSAVLGKWVITMQDPDSFLTGARDIAAHGWFTAGHRWLIHLWPPGFMVLESWVLRLLGPANATIGALIVLASLAHSIALMLLSEALPKRLGPLRAFLPLAIFLLPTSRAFLLEPFGVILGETFSIATFISAFALLCISLRERSRRAALAAGAFLALSTYFRSQFEILVTMISVVAIASWAFQSFRARALDRSFVTVAMVLALGTTHALMFPWRLHNYLTLKHWSWVQTQQLVYEASLSPKSAFDGAAAFTMAGGGHLACHFEPTYCGKKQGKFFYKAYFKNLLRWNAYKANLFPGFWFTNAANYGAVQAIHPYDFSFGRNAYDWVALLFAFAMLPSLWLVSKRPEFAAYRTFVVGTVLFYGVVFSLVTFESRYFFLLKIFAMTAATVWVPLLFDALKSPRTAAPLSGSEATL